MRPSDFHALACAIEKRDAFFDECKRAGAESVTAPSPVAPSDERSARLAIE
jgi:hypothetical protein